jgi:hypothetical protein
MTKKARLLGALAGLAGIATASIRLEFPGQSPGPPFYAQISNLPGLGLEVHHTDEWAAIPFVRELNCVPPDFNLLNLFDAPAAFGCMLTVQGFEIRKSLAPEDIRPIQAKLWGLGAVPILFVSWPELQPAVADGVLTLTELRSLPSLRIGYASFFSMEFHPWAPGDDFRGANLQISARGILQDGRQFQFLYSGVHVPKQQKHVLIRFW